MLQKDLIVLIILALIVIVGIGIGGYYLLTGVNPVSSLVPNTENTNNENSENEKVVVPDITVEEQIKQFKKDYPEVVTGVINFLDTKTTEKTTLKADDGKEYVLWPSQPKSIYEALGVKNKDRVEIQARFVEDNKIEWGIIKAI